MPENDSGQRLDFDIFHRLPLDLGKVADLVLREFDVVDRLRRHLGDEGADLVNAEPEACRRPFVEALRELAHCHIAALLHIGDDRLHRAAHLRVGFLLLTV